METTSLYHATEFFTPFPDPATVFSRNVEEHRRYLLPLASLDLRAVDPRLAGWVHFIQPIEPWDGVVGEGGEAHFNYLCRENYVGYRYAPSGACELATDFRYFEMARPPASPPLRPSAIKHYDALIQHYDDVRRGFAKARGHFLEDGVLYGRYARSPYKAEDRIALLGQLGGLSLGGNWAEGSEFPKRRETILVEDEDGEEDEEQIVLPLTEDGRPFLFVGQSYASGWLITESFALCCELLLFYDPETRTALTTFDWS